MFLACHYGHTDICLRLMGLGERPGDHAPTSAASPDAGGSGRTPVHCVALMGHYECLVSMLEAGATFLEVDSDGVSAEALAKDEGNYRSAEALALARWNHRVGEKPPPKA